MIAKCAGCDKTVYPAEKLSCLDRAWHKTCFKCQVCGMALSLKNYKGYQKKPYCGPHYPKVTYTQVADTPENARLKSNSEALSKAKYQAEFNKSKGNYTQIADTAESLRLKETSENISKAKYQAEFNKSKGNYTQVADSIENVRLKENTDVQSKAKYQADFQKMKGTKLSVSDDVTAQHTKQVNEMTSKVKYQKDFHEQIKGQGTATADDLRTEYLKGLQDKISNTKYQEQFKKEIVGTKTSVSDDVMSTYLKETQAKITSIGYRQKTDSSSSRPVSMNLSEIGAAGVLDEEPQGPPEDLITPQGLSEDLTTPQGPPEDLITPQGLSEDLTTPQGPPEDLITPQGLSEDLTTPQGPPEDLITPQGLSEDLITPQGLSEDLTTPQGPPEDAIPQAEEEKEARPVTSSKRIDGKRIDSGIVEDEMVLTSPRAGEEENGGGAPGPTIHVRSDEVDDDVFDMTENRDLRSSSLSEHMSRSVSSPSLLDRHMSQYSPLPDVSGSASPISVSVGKLKKIKTISDSISIFRTTLTHGALSRLIADDDDD